MKDQRLSKKSMGYYTIGMVFYLFCQWLTTIIVVRINGYGDAGNLSLAMSLSNSFSSIALYGTKSFQVSDIQNEYASGEYISTRIITCTGSILACVVFLGIQHYTPEVVGCIVAFMLFRVVEAVVDVFQGIEQKAWKMDLIGKSFLLRGSVSIVSFTLILLVLHNLILAILAMVISSFVVICLFDIRQSRRLDSVRPVFSAKPIQRLLLTCLPLTINTFITTGLVTIPRLFLEGYYGNEMLGIYSSIAAPTVIVQTAATLIFNPLITLFANDYADYNRDDFVKRLKKSCLILISLSLIAIAGAAVVGKLGLWILFGKDILPYFYLLVPVVLYSTLYVCAWFIQILLTIMREFKGLLVGNIVSLIACLLLSPFVVKAFDMNGVNLTLILSSVIQAVVFGIFAVRRGKEHFLGR